MSGVMAPATSRALPGSPVPFGATPGDGGTNFAVASGADAVELCLFDEAGGETRVALAEYDAGVWHGFVPGVGPGQAYGYRMTGPFDPARGLRFNPAKLLLDPYARAIEGQVRFGPEVLGYDAEDPDRAQPARLGGPRAAQPGRRPHVRLARCAATSARLRRHGPLRDPRQGLHRGPPGRPRTAARHLRRAGAPCRAGPPGRHSA